MKKYIVTFVLLFAFAMVGCDENYFESFSDDDTTQARLEEARMALDDENYAEALAILGELDPCDVDVAKYLSSAYMGMANFNALDLAANAEELADSDNEGSIELISSVLDTDGDEQITLAEITAGLAEAENAIAAMLHLFTNCEGAQITCDDITLLGVSAALHVTYVVLESIQIDLGEDPIPVTEQGIHDKYEGRNFDTNSLSEPRRIDLNNGIEYVDNAIACMVEDDEVNDLAENFEEFLAEIDPDRNGDITRNELANYIESIGD